MYSHVLHNQRKKTKVEERFKIRNPELEAEIYYLTKEEGGRETAVRNGYRGQFYYDGKDWDAPQEFIEKEVCYPGDKVRVKIQTLSPDFHVGRFWKGKEFKVREGGETVGNGIIREVLLNDFNYWEYKAILEDLPKDVKPYDKENIEGFIVDFDYLLGAIEEIREVSCEINLSNQNEMIKVHCELKDEVKNPRPLLDEVCKCWREELRFKKSKYKTDLDFKNNKFKFVLSFITWHSMYLTGKIIIEK